MPIESILIWVGRIGLVVGVAPGGLLSLFFRDVLVARDRGLL